MYVSCCRKLDFVKCQHVHCECHISVFFQYDFETSWHFIWMSCVGYLVVLHFTDSVNLPWSSPWTIFAYIVQVSKIFSKGRHTLVSSVSSDNQLNLLWGHVFDTVCVEILCITANVQNDNCSLLAFQIDYQFCLFLVSLLSFKCCFLLYHPWLPSDSLHVLKRLLH